MLEKFIPYIGALAITIGAILTWMSAGRKSSVDESGIVFNQWKSLMESHKEDMKTLKAEFNEYKSGANTEIQGLRERLNTVEDDFATFRRESDERIRLLDEENRGLRKEIAKVGKTAHAEVRKVAEGIAASEGEKCG